MREISFIGEDNFFFGCQLLNFSKNDLSEKDKVGLEDKSNFDVFMSIVTDRNPKALKNSLIVNSVLALLFPNYAVIVNKKEGIILKDNNNFSSNKIDNSNFEEFKNLLSQMLVLDNKAEDKDAFNPADEAAARIAAKLMKGRQTVAKEKENLSNTTNKDIDIYNRYISILAVGLKINKNELLNYTPYQLTDMFKRYLLKQDFEMYLKAKMAGAKDLEEVEDWMKEL